MNSRPQAADTAMNRSMAAWITRRGSNRSASAPVWIEKNRKGSQCATTANPPRVGDSNFSQITR